MRRCDKCEWWVRKPDGYGACHKRSPIAIADGYEAGTTVWPDIKHDDWCGEFKEKQ